MHGALSPPALRAGIARQRQGWLKGQQMKIVIAPDSRKESLSALEVASAIEQGFREIYPDAEYVKLPVADGGKDGGSHGGGDRRASGSADGHRAAGRAG